MKLLVMLLCLSAVARAQSTESESVVESLLENSAEAEDLQFRGEELEYLRSHPVNVSEPSYGELLRIPFISPLLAESMILFSDTVKIVEVEQLRDAALMTPMLFEQIAPFITAGKTEAVNGLDWLMPGKAEMRSRMEQRLQRTKGFEEHKYGGGPLGSYQRVRLENHHLEFAAMAEKDPGERYRDGFIAGYAEVRDLSVIDDLIVGNYSAGVSQGLVFAKNIASSKGSDAAGQVRRKGGSLTPSVSTDEFRYFRGTAVRLRFLPLSVTGLYSLRRLPASIDTNGTVSSFYTSGMYRNENELKRRDRLTERMTGGTIEYQIGGNASVSFTGMNVEYGSDVAPSAVQLRGSRSIRAGSIGWTLPLQSVLTFGETASNDGKRFSSVVGIILSVSRALSVSYHHRSFSTGYSSPYARPFGERTEISDGELGNYLGVECRIGRTTLSAFADLYSFPARGHAFPSTGKETFFQIETPVSPRSRWTFQWKHVARTQDIGYEKMSYRIAYAYRLSPAMTITQRFDAVRYHDLTAAGKESGFLAFIDGQYHDRTQRYSIRTRMTWFRSVSYNSRLYHYEPDVPGNFSNPPLYGDGLRWFILVRGELFVHCSLGLKYSETKKLHEHNLGSGDDRIVGNLESRGAIQVDFRF